jgi:hypothetical protein
MLEVGPDRCTFPKPVSLAVSMAKTLLLLASKAAKMFRVGEVAISPGELPALSGETRARVSFEPLINTRPPRVKVEVTPCEARTRFFRGELYPPQETRLSPAHKRATRTRMRFFKRQAPNDMKKGDLVAKWWIITDPALHLTQALAIELSDRFCFQAFLHMVTEMHEPAFILYSQELYGG